MRLRREEAIDKAIASRGAVDVLFNNVGTQPPESMRPLHELPEELWHRILSVNLTSAYHTCKAVLPGMIGKKKGVIINNASIQAVQSQPNVSAYASSKGGLVALTRQIAVDYGRYNIRCNAVSPGSTLTPLMMKTTNTEYARSNTPLPRLGDPNDMANIVFFLASQEAEWLTGQNLIVDGGITSKGGWAALSD